MSTKISRDVEAHRALDASKAMLGPQHKLAYKIIWELGAVTGVDLNEHCRQTEKKVLPLHTYLDDLAALGWIHRVGRGKSRVTGKVGTLWEITGTTGSRYKDKDQGGAGRLSAMTVVSSMIGYVKSRGTTGATYYEWWSNFRTARGAALNTDTAAQYFGTLSARWKELQRVNVLVPTNTFRSQQDTVTDTTQKASLSNKPARVFVLREGASVADYITGNKKAPPADTVQLTHDEAEVLAEYRRIRSSWPRATSHPQQERLLLKLSNTAVKAINASHRDTSTKKEAA